jgi:hypothetical protein
MDGIVQAGTDLYIREQSPRPDETYILTGRTLISPSLLGGQATALIITIGQSTSNNSVNSLDYYQNHGDALDPAVAYTPTNGNLVQNLSIGNKGAIFSCVDPLLGGELLLSHYAPRLADKLINAGTYARVILAPIGLGGSWCADWCPGGGTVGSVDNPSPNPVTGVLAYRIGLLARCLYSVGLLNNPGLAASMVLWQQGEWDSDGTAGGTGTSQANYQAALQGVINEFRNWGMRFPFLVALCTRPGSGNALAVRSAQSAVVNNSAAVYAGPDIDTIGSTTADRYDGTHFVGASLGSGQGVDKQTSLWQTAILAAPH